MRKHTKILAGTFVLATAGWFAGCNGTIDKEPNVVLEVETLTVPPITSTQNAAGGACTYTITSASGTFKNKPKNQFAGTSPFNDIILQTVSIAYVWDDLLVQDPVTAGLGGSVPANGSATALFSVVSNAALEEPIAAPPNPSGRAGHTASLSLTFNGTTVSGDAVSATTGASLQVNSCVVNFGVCCTSPGNPNCTDTDQTTCLQIPGAIFQGNNTVCATTTCN